jgi:hypothetical protein
MSGGGWRVIEIQEDRMILPQNQNPPIFLQILFQYAT